MATKIKTKVTIILCLLASAILLNACTQLIGNKGKISITLPTKNARSITADDISEYEITLIDSTGEIIESVKLSGQTHTFDELIPGEYKIKVDAFKEGSDKPAASGDTTVQVVAGKTANARITLKEIVEYTVEHWYELLEPDAAGNNYELGETETLKGIAGAQAEYEEKLKDGFEFYSISQQTITKDAIIQIYYNRKLVNINIFYYDSNAEIIQKKYGAKLEVPNPEREGYVFKGWTDETGADVELPETCIKDATFVAKWVALKDSTIEVELPGGERISYLISPDGNELDSSTLETIKYEKGNPIVFTIFVEANDDTSGSGQPTRTQLDADAHTITWFVDGVLQEKENGSTFTWDTEKVSSGLHEILCVIDGAYSVISKPIVAVVATN